MEHVPLIRLLGATNYGIICTRDWL